MSDLKTTTDAIRTDARMWDRQSVAIGDAATAIKGLRRTQYEFGLFVGFFDAYMDCVDFLSDRCTEGKSAMSDIADTLVKNAKAYDDHEVDTKKSVEDAY